MHHKKVSRYKDTDRCLTRTFYLDQLSTIASGKDQDATSHTATTILLYHLNSAIIVSI